MREFSETNGVTHRPPATGFQKNDGFKTLMRLKAHFAGIPVDDVPADVRIRRWMEMFRTVLPPESLFPRRPNEQEQGFWI